MGNCIVNRLNSKAMRQFTRQTPNGLRYLRVGGRGQNFESKILFGRGKCSKMAQNPTRQVHALLAGV